MKKIIFLGIGVSIIFVTLGMIASIFHRINFSRQTWPNVQLYIHNGEPYNLTKKRNKVLVFFKSDCFFCEQMANTIINSENIIDSEVLFISSEHPDSILLFSLNHYSDKLTYLCDETTLFSKELKVKKYPTIFVYNGKSQKLVNRFVGAVPMEQILEVLRNE